MTVKSFSGGAGTGKTYQLISSLRERLAALPLRERQKVLAVTFMHGARVRLDERLSRFTELKTCYDCSTLDSLAWRVVRRWAGLAQHLGVAVAEPHSFDAVIRAAGLLIEQDVVAKWIAATYPLLLIDESQDLSAPRLRIVAALAKYMDVLAAADEFQCLDESLRPNPACLWLESAGEITMLGESKRTHVEGLLSAAAALRSGKAPLPCKPHFQIALASNTALAGTFLSNAIGWYAKGKSLAIISPADGTYARRVTEWVSATKSNQGNGPFSIRWEEGEARAADHSISALNLAESNDLRDVEKAVSSIGNPRLATLLCEWMDVRRRCLGKQSFTRAELQAAILRLHSGFRRVQFDGPRRATLAMTVHAAKNREFDQVVVLWPAALKASAEQKRRLLYNAITRARERVLVLVQAKEALSAPPFV